MLRDSVRELGSGVAAMAITIATFQQFSPKFVCSSIENGVYRVKDYIWPEAQITFYEFNKGRASENFNVIESYLASITVTTSTSAINAKRLRGYTPDKRSSTKSFVCVLDDFEEVDDEFEGCKFNWSSGKVVETGNKTIISEYPGSDENRYFTLTCSRNYGYSAIEKYLTYVMEKGEALQKKRRTRMMYTNRNSSYWRGDKSGFWHKVVFQHPAKFDNLAIDPAKKEEIMQDLLAFSQSKDFYTTIGKAWKRGYLLYGPPGTGKSTMIACMANFLGYDVYDIELTAIGNNSDLRNLLTSIGGKSIIVIEDIDCTLPVTAKRDERHGDNDSNDNDSDDETDADSQSSKRGGKKSSSKKKSKSEVTLSGLLNTMDGLWSPCSEERIIVFTTNHIEKLDPALLRTGRMDVHIEMSYCTFEAFKVFARNYLNIESHPLFVRIEELLSLVKIRPCDVAENLLPKRLDEDPERGLERALEAFEKAYQDQALEEKAKEVQAIEKAKVVQAALKKAKEDRAALEKAKEVQASIEVGKEEVKTLQVITEEETDDETDDEFYEVNESSSSLFSSLYQFGGALRGYLPSFV